MPTKAKLYISWIAAAGLIVLAAGLSRWQSTGLPRLLAFLFLAMILSTQKIRVPGMKGTMSLSFPFILVGIADFGFGETLLLGCTAAFVQTLWHAKTPPRPEQIVFNMGTLVLSAGFLVLPLMCLCHLWYQIHIERTVRAQAAVPTSDEFYPVLVQR